MSSDVNNKHKHTLKNNKRANLSKLADYKKNFFGFVNSSFWINHNIFYNNIMHTHTHTKKIQHVYCGLAIRNIVINHMVSALALPSLQKGCGLWTLSCDFVPHN